MPSRVERALGAGSLLPARLLESIALVCVLFIPFGASDAASLTVTSETFNPAPVAGGSSTATFSFTWPVSSAPSVRLQFGSEFSFAQPVCTGSNPIICSVTVTFAPLHPGLRQDALRAFDSAGAVLTTSYLSGVGLGFQPVLWPGVIAPFAGSGAWGSSGDAGPAASATLGNPQGLATDAAGNLYIADSLGEVVRRVDAVSHIITTVAGNTSSVTLGDGGPATLAKLTAPTGVAVDGAGNLYIADFGNNRVRRVDALSGVITTVAGNGNPNGITLGDGGTATTATLCGPSDVALDSAGNLYIADSYNNRVRKVDPSGIITTFAGGGTPGAGADGIGNGGPAVNAQLRNPCGLAFDASGALYIADRNFNLVRVVRAGIISVVAGNGSANDSGDGGQGMNASLSSPVAVRVDAAGNVYIADSGNSVVRVVDGAGIIRTLAGEAGQYGLSGNGGSPLSAQINNPGGLAIDDYGTLYIADQGNRAVRAVAPPTLALNFAPTSVGALSVPQIVTLENIGNQPLPVNSLALSGDFLQQSSGAPDCAAAAAILSGESCSVAVVFAPQGPGTRSGTLAVAAGGRTSTPTVVSLAGTATATPDAKPVVAPQTLAFASRQVLSASPPQSFTLANPGTSTLSLASAWLSGSNASDFSLSQTCGPSLPPGASCTISVVFTPLAVGQRTATLALTEFVTGTSISFAQTVFLAGSASAPGPTLSPASLSFGEGALHVATTSRIITVSNPGPLTLTLSGVTVSDAANFSFTGTTCGQTLAAGHKCTISVAMTPTAGGPFSATLNVYDSAADSPQTMTLEGSGSIPMLFVPVSPCRIADTRDPIGPFGGPEMQRSESRTFLIPNSSCGIPPTASAYALNVTVVPTGGLGFLSIWPTGSPQPDVSTLNSDGRTKANAAIVLAGTAGGVNVYTSDPTHVILDVNGYFAPATSTPGGLAFYPVAPCRVADTRSPVSTFGGPALQALQGRAYPIRSSACNIPAAAQAYSLNLTAIPHRSLGFLSAWPTGKTRPNVSTLNAFTGAVTANAAIVPANAQGSIDLFATDLSDLVLDINGYFAPPGPGGLSLYATRPCRLLDSRSAGHPLAGSHAFRLSATAGACSAPPTATAVTFNSTVVPVPTLGFLALWPEAQGQPNVSTLNAFDGSVTSNMAIVPLNAGVLDVFPSDAAHVILDMFSYFAP